MANGAMNPGYPSIVASGPNATTLHYEKSARQMKDGDLLLIDAAASYQGLTGDLTRTYPVNGTFTPEQKDVYRIVLAAQDAGVRAAVAGNTTNDVEKAVAAHDAAASMWEQTSIRPQDVDVMELYDGFSYLTLQWIEALGFCEHGDAGRYVDGGARIALDGERPLNTQGGQLSGGRLHGLGFLHEACVQLWREGGARQVPTDVEVAVAAAGGGPIGGCLLVSRRS